MCASIFRFEAQVSMFWPALPQNKPSPSYRCLYPEPAPACLAPSCSEVGVLGVLPGVMGTLQAVEAVKLVLAETLVGRLLSYNALAGTFHSFKSAANPHCRYCADPAMFPGYVDYEAFCASSESD